MNIAEVFYPKLSSGIIPTFLDSYSFSVPSNKSFSYTPILNKPDSYYLNGGCTTVAVNEGIDSSSGIDNVPFDQRSCFISNPEFIRNGGGRLSVGEMNQDDCNNAVDAFLNGRSGGYKIITSGANEAYEELLPWLLNPDTVPNQARWISQRFATRLAPLGGRYYHTYDGILSLLPVTGDMANSDPLRGPLADPATAFAFCCEHSGFGNLFFKGNEYEFRHGIINTYWAGKTNSFNRILEFMCAFQICRNALISKGSGARLMSFMFAAQSEFTDYLQLYDLPVSDGNTLAYTFPQFADSVNLILAYVSMLMCEDAYAWMDSQRRGTNPNYVRHSGFNFTHIGNGSATEIDPFNRYKNEPAPYIEARYAGHDALMAGVSQFCRSAAWAGQDWFFAGHRPAGSANFCSTGPLYLADRHQAQEPIAIVHTYSNRRALFFFDLAARPGSWKDYEIDLNGATYTLTAEGGMPYHRLMEL